MWGTTEDILIKAKLSIVSNSYPTFNPDAGLDRRGFLEELKNRFVDKNAYASLKATPGVYLRDPNFISDFRSNPAKKLALVHGYNIRRSYTSKYKSKKLKKELTVEVKPPNSDLLISTPTPSFQLPIENSSPPTDLPEHSSENFSNSNQSQVLSVDQSVPSQIISPLTVVSSVTSAPRLSVMETPELLYGFSVQELLKGCEEKVSRCCCVACLFRVSRKLQLLPWLKSNSTLGEALANCNMDKFLEKEAVQPAEEKFKTDILTNVGDQLELKVVKTSKEGG